MIIAMSYGTVDRPRGWTACTPGGFMAGQCAAPAGAAVPPRPTDVALKCGDAVALNSVVRGAWKVRQDAWIDRYASSLTEGAKLELGRALV